MKRFLCIVLLVAWGVPVVWSIDGLSSTLCLVYRGTIPPGALTMTGVAIDSAETNGMFVISDIDGGLMPIGSSALLWDSAQQQYVSENKLPFGWLPGTNIIYRGRGLFLKAPTGVTSDVQFGYGGLIPVNLGSTSTVFSLVTNLTMITYPYPVSIPWTNTTLSQVSASGASIYLWDDDTQSYDTYGKTRGGWGAATNLVLVPGVGLYFLNNTTNPLSWTEERPYTWP
ncbi:MAG: hypothetical protein H7A43_12045 [Verrucomicrobia bacterium]|nr:hypothetical protein [Saprospiraceae bacterium]MCB1070256.1 hypothetical protein [Kiritimatiellia bacterium]MCP5489366.1 hypothetical protein [Verrucomicrobiota bacterium]